MTIDENAAAGDDLVHASITSQKGEITFREALELERWNAERQFRERELAIREREIAIKEHTLTNDEKGAKRAWASPLVISILVAAMAAGGNALVAYMNGNSERRLEAQKSEQARILEMIKTGDPDKAATNLEFLLEAGLISDRKMRTQIGDFLSSRTPGNGPVLPTVVSPSSPYQVPTPWASLSIGAIHPDTAKGTYKALLTWTAKNVDTVVVTETESGSTEQIIATSINGSKMITQLNSGHQYRFAICDVVNGNRITLASVTANI